MEPQPLPNPPYLLPPQKPVDHWFNVTTERPSAISVDDEGVEYSYANGKQRRVYWSDPKTVLVFKDYSISVRDYSHLQVGWEQINYPFELVIKPPGDSFSLPQDVWLALQRDCGSHGLLRKRGVQTSGHPTPGLELTIFSLDSNAEW